MRHLTKEEHAARKSGQHIDAVHVFERAGLGLAPFRCVGFREEVFQAIPGDPNCPVQPGASCHYCGTAIRFVCLIESADGKGFKVGCDCVAQTGDAGLRKSVAAFEKKRNAAKATERKAKLAELLRDPAIRAKLAATPHPMHFQRERGEMALDWADWMSANAGNAGRTRALSLIRKITKEAK